MSEPPTFAPIPARAMADERLAALDFRVLAALAVHDRLGANGIGCYASHPRLAALVGCHVKSLSRSLRALAEAGYIDAKLHPMNKRLRVYRVVYTDFDRACFGQKPGGGIGNEAATELHAIGNEAATDDDRIGSQIVPEAPSIGNQVGKNNKEKQDVVPHNILGETYKKSCETEKRSCETGQEITNRRTGAGVASTLAMIERGARAGRPQGWWRNFVESIANSPDPDTPNCQLARRLRDELWSDLEAA